ncbi:MAG: HIT domain-containing protein [Alphaproteobacteria bacterium]
MVDNLNTLNDDSPEQLFNVDHHYDDNNVFAKILREELPCTKVYEDDYALAFYDAQPCAKQHILVIPKGPYVSSQDFYARASEDEIVGFCRAIATVAEKEKLVDTGYRTIANHGEHARQEVPHMHVHLVGGEDLKGMLNL